MALATRCTFCGTAFRVVEDQLKVSGGWVRCGQCSKVFNGREGLIDLERQAEPDTPSENPGAAAPASATEAGTFTAAAAQPPIPDAPAATMRSAEPLVEAGPYRFSLASGGSPAGPTGDSAASAEQVPADAPADAATALSMAGLLARPSNDAALEPATPAATAGERADPEAASATVEPSQIDAPAGPIDAPATPVEVELARETAVNGAPESALPAPSPAEMASMPRASALEPAPLDTSPEIHVVFTAEPAMPDAQRAADDAGPESERTPFDPNAAASDTTAPGDAAGDATPPSAALLARDDADAAPLGVEADGEPAEALPTFLQTPARPARRQARRTRQTLALVVGVAALALLMQVAHHYRDSLAARSPLARAALAGWCDVAGCRIDAPRAIEAIVLDSSALVRDPTLDAFRLAVTLRSQSDVALSMPAIDLRLTGSSGELVARRVLPPGELGAPALLPARSELALQAVLAVRDPRVTGYTVEVFYP